MHLELVSRGGRPLVLLHSCQSMNIKILFLWEKKNIFTCYKPYLLDWEEKKRQSYYKTEPSCVSDPEGFIDVIFHSMEQQNFWAKLSKKYL